MVLDIKDRELLIDGCKAFLRLFRVALTGLVIHTKAEMYVSKSDVSRGQSARVSSWCAATIRSRVARPAR